MFNGGVSLRYLNLYHFTVYNGINYENIFGGLKSDVIYCIFQESTKNLLYLFISLFLLVYLIAKYVL